MIKSIVESFVAFFIAAVGLIGGFLWVAKSGWDPEPIILIIVSALEIFGFLIVRVIIDEAPPLETPKVNNEQKVQINWNVVEPQKATKTDDEKPFIEMDRRARIDSMKPKTQVLFIDDDKNFNVVKILKDSGWKNTKTTVDIKNLDIPIVRDAHLFFIDINGVGKLLNLPNEGLDLALMLKQKYPEKKVVIYSANKTTNAFHDAWGQCDYKLEKNALPYQFENIVEQVSLELFNSIK